MKNRIKIPAISLVINRDDADLMVNDLALIIARQRQTISDRDSEILAITEKYAPKLAFYEQSIKARTEALEAWASVNPNEFPKNRKSIQFASGSIGYRTGTPKLSLISRAFNWEKALDLLKSIPLWRNYVRIKEEVDKEALLAAHSQAEDKPAFEMSLRGFGLKVTQSESFYMDPLLTKMEARQTVEAN